MHMPWKTRPSKEIPTFSELSSTLFGRSTRIPQSPDPIPFPPPQPPLLDMALWTRSEAVTVGLHRVGQTLVLDGNLGEVLVSAKPPAPATPSGSRAGACPTPHGNGSAGGASAPRAGRDVGIEKVGAEQEGRWVMVGRGGKPRRGDEWERAEEEAEVALRDERHGRRRRGRGSGEATDADGDWSVYQANWPRLGSSGEDALGSGELAIIPTRPRGGSFGGRPPEPVGFWRAFQWEVAGMRLVLGSSLQVRFRRVIRVWSLTCALTLPTERSSTRIVDV